ncbi:hypothetical protein diail_10619 [Diaporthe ilicicola]|nr:hypothetical protein diail_10619 [Diaporthe ilicicola]
MASHARTRRRRRQPSQLWALAAMLSTASAVSLNDLQPIANGVLPTMCNMAYNAPFMGCTTADFASGERCSDTCRSGIKTVEQVISMLASKHNQHTTSAKQHSGIDFEHTGSTNDSSDNFHTPGFELNYKEYRIVHHNTHTFAAASLEHSGDSTSAIIGNSYCQFDLHTTTEFDDFTAVDNVNKSGSDEFAGGDTVAQHIINERHDGSGYDSIISGRWTGSGRR